MTDSEHTDHPMLFLTEGGPTYRIEKSVGLIHDQSSRTAHRAIFSICLTWIPLFVLCLLGGTAYGDRVAIPFLRDFAAYARFLLALPLLIVAVTIIGPHIAHSSAHFIRSGLVVEEDFKRFDEAVEKGLRWRDSVIAEIILVCREWFDQLRVIYDRTPQTILAIQSWSP